MNINNEWTFFFKQVWNKNKGKVGVKWEWENKGKVGDKWEWEWECEGFSVRVTREGLRWKEKRNTNKNENGCAEKGH